MSSGLPGGSVQGRPLHFIWIVDTSQSMGSSGKIETLNRAATEALPHMRDAAAREAHVDMRVRVLAFDDAPRWIQRDPSPVEDFTWPVLDTGGRTAMGSAL